MMPDIASITSVINFIGALTLAFLCGAFTVVLVVLYVANEYSKHLPFFEKKPKVQYEKVQLGELLHKNLHNDRGTSVLDEKESCRFLNMFFAFIFREWRDTNQLRRWVLKKINIEFMEFMETKTASRLLQGIKIHDVKLGTNFPVFHSAQIKEPYSFTDNELPEQVTLELDMEYHGGFYLAIDVDLVFGKTAFLAVQVTYLKGKVRLQYSRSPCTHWSISFVEEPDIRFHVETSFETRQLPQLTSLIVNQIRRTIRRKHTLPHYKMRYTPFFSFQHPEVSPFEGFISDIPVQPAVLEVCIAACTRLLISSRGEKERNAESPNYVIFATISVNVESCIGKPLFRLRPASSSKPDLEPASSRTLAPDLSTPRNTPTSTKTPVSGGVRTSTTFDSLQRSLLGLRKDQNEKAQKPEPMNQRTTLSTTFKQTKLKDISNAEAPHTDLKAEALKKKPRRDSESSSTSSAAGATYVMVAMNFGATLREEISQKDGGKSVVVGNITEHCVTGQSGMKDGDIVIELNGEAISSLSQAITKIEKIRANRGSFRFKVRRSKSDSETLFDTPLQEMQGKSAGSLDDTESDHSDVDLADYQDFVNISLQVAEMHSAKNTTQKSSISPGPENSRTHSRSMSSLNDSADTPYMTLVSTPKKEMKNVTAPDSANRKSNQKKLLPVKKAAAHRSRSESPPLLRNSEAITKSKSTPNNSARSSSLKDGKRTAHSNLQQRVDKKRDSPSSTHRLRAMASPSSSIVPQDLLSSESDKVGLSFTDQSDQPIPFPIPSRPSENLSFARVDDELDTQLFKTTLVNSNQREYSWKNDTFSFSIKEKHRYLNVRYWTQLVGKKGIIKTRQPQVVACLSIPICELETLCRAVTSRTVTRCFRLCTPNELPNDHKWFLSDPVSNRSSFREEYCFGDSTLTISLVPKPSNKNNSNHCYNAAEHAGKFIPGDDTNGMSKEFIDRLNQRTGSNFLLSAAIDSGRRLLVTRETQTASAKAQPSSDMLTPSPTPCPEPDAAAIVEPKEESAKEKMSLTQLIKGFISGRKDISEPKQDSVMEESVSDLKELDPVETVAELSKGSEDNRVKSETVPDKSDSHQFDIARFTSAMKCAFCNNKIWSKSGLQCKLCLSVCHKKCVARFKSDIGCPGTEKKPSEKSVKSEDLVECESDNDNDSSSDNSNALPSMAMDFRNKILGLAKEGSEKKDVEVKKNFPRAKNSEDMLAVNAKEMGRDLHRDLPLSERRVMLENLLQKVEDQLHSEIDGKESLLQEHRNSPGPSKKLEKKIVKSDERLQALALLLLHYRAGLEDCDFESNEAEIADERSEISVEADCKTDGSSIENRMLLPTLKESVQP